MPCNCACKPEYHLETCTDFTPWGKPKAAELPSEELLAYFEQLLDEPEVKLAVNPHSAHLIYRCHVINEQARKIKGS